ncbi:LADA_0H13168g1_1 [Lachancea dasiensis]|uniref:LADA_0H13168g1_1 n=1 Tax=Lachancea dasiensis TaxID=1072105 RepID=A0A1G4K443_9SACH|nr:LADA_0H13168g1_1 [Lachancea dasiensis]
MSKASLEAQLETEIAKIIKAHSDTAVSEAQKEIESNYAYINDKQLKKLIGLHDDVLQHKCGVPLQKLYDKYSQFNLQHGNLQNWAELIDRDLRVLEATIERVWDNRREDGFD